MIWIRDNQLLHIFKVFHSIIERKKVLHISAQPISCQIYIHQKSMMSVNTFLIIGLDSGQNYIIFWRCEIRCATHIIRESRRPSSMGKCVNGPFLVPYAAGGNFEHFSCIRSLGSCNRTSNESVLRTLISC